MSLIPKEQVQYCFTTCDEHTKKSGLCDCENRFKNLISVDFTETDKIIYGTPDVKLKSLEASKTKVIAKN